MAVPTITTTVTKSDDPVVAPGHDPVVVAYSDPNSTTTDRLRACQMGLARQYATLRWLEEHPNDLDDLVEAGRAISRRMRALKRLTEIELKEHRLEGGSPDVDLHGPVARQVVALLVDKLANVTTDVISADDADKIVSMFEGRIEADPDVPWP